MSIYSEKRISVKEQGPNDDEPKQVEYREWNAFRSKLASAIVCGATDVFIHPGSTVLYLGAASGTTVSHVSDMVGAEGKVYAVEFSLRSGRDLMEHMQKRSNVIPIIEDARYPSK